ncbi:MAG: methionyl-tRNA formyltransferase [Spirochaetaceae bacterium]|jgi:methionyl-tRNA formyltransferase|nr:methionyl-tRNA formyltransferase [Spirochaetaceae bacterium]
MLTTVGARIRVLFAGSPEIAAPSLEALTAPGMEEACEVVGVLTNPDTPKGRRGTPGPTAVGAAGETLSAVLREQGKAPFPVLKPEKLNGEAREAVAALKPDLLVSFAYGRIFGPKFLGLFPQGGINIHPSLLPKYRGPAPIQAAILNRDAETGISIQRIALQMDAGDILIQERFPLTGRETAGSLGGIAAQKSAVLLTSLIRELAGGGAAGTPQDHERAVYCRLLNKEDGRIDWNADAWEIDARIRAFTPWPLCLTRHGEADLYILEGRPWEPAEPSVEPPGTVLGVDKSRGILIQTGKGIYAAERLQYRTRKALDWRSFLNGAPGFTGSRLT